MVIQQCKIVVTMQKYVRKWLVQNAYMKLLSTTIFMQCCWRQKLVKFFFWRLKQDQLKLKRESKTKETNKPFEVMSLKSENKVSLKKKIREEREKNKIWLRVKKGQLSQEWREENKDEKRKECKKYR